jgi:acetyl esterase/lipase
MERGFDSGGTMRRIGLGLVLTMSMLSGVVSFGQPPAAPAGRTPPPVAAIGPNDIVGTPLWASATPGALGTTEDDIPTLAEYLPASNPTKTAVIIMPGGGYTHLSMIKEGSDVARWLNAHGVAAYVLRYRLGMKYHNPIELGDAKRAIRTVRAQAAAKGFAADHIGIWGFSAGGHLAASAGTMYDAGDPAATDPIDQQSSKPSFMILSYPVITMQDPYVHKGSRLYLLGESPTPAEMDAMSPEMHVTKDTPTTFIFATTDDGTVPVLNSVMFYSALVKAKVPVEMHLFQHGGHGAGLAPTNPQLSPWVDLLIKWMRERGYAAAAAPATP